MKLYLTTAVLLTHVILSGCSDSHAKKSTTRPVVNSSASSQSSAEPYQGVWQADAYGRTFEVKWNGSAYDISTYLFTQDYCLISEKMSNVTTAEVAAIAHLNEDGSYLEIRTSELIPGPIFTQKTAIPSVCQTGLSTTYGNEGYQFNPEADFQFFWQYFNEHYFDFELSGTNWAMLYEQFYPQAIAAESEAELFEIFAEIIEPLEDSHVYVSLNTRGEGFENADAVHNISAKPTISDQLTKEFLTEEALTLPLSAEQEAVFAAYYEQRIDGMIATLMLPAEDDTIESALDNFLWYITEDNIGYLLITSMSEFSEEGLDEQTDFVLATQLMQTIMADLIQADGLVIDIRLNNGGFDLVSHAIAKHFFTDETLVYRKQARLNNARTPLRDVYIKPADTLNFTGPIALLTSHNTVSAAEIFTLIMRERPNTTLIGESTAGALSDILESRVTSPIHFGLSNEWYFTPDGTWFERQGIPADIHVPFPSIEGHDEALTRALEYLMQQ